MRLTNALLALVLLVVLIAIASAPNNEAQNEGDFKILQHFNATDMSNISTISEKEMNIEFMNPVALDVTLSFTDRQIIIALLNFSYFQLHFLLLQ